MATSPVVARWELSRRLASRRKELGLDVKAITDHLGFTRNYWSAVENDRTLIAADKLAILLDLLQFEEPDRTELDQLRADARQRGWWDARPSLEGDAKRFYGLEDGATRIRTYESLIIPGLLQIEDYTRALIGADPFNRPVDVDRALELRKARQERLLSGNRIEFVALMSQAALTQQVGGPKLQARQLDHIADRIEEATSAIEVRVLPFETNPGIIASSSTLVFFDFESAQLPTIAWQEAIRPLDVVESNDEQFNRLKLAWDDGIRRSLSREASLEMIKRESTLVLKR